MLAVVSQSYFLLASETVFTTATRSARNFLAFLGSDILLDTGATVGLGHILFDVSATAPSQTVPVTFAAFPATSLSDHLSNHVPIESVAGGQINITGTAVPEPASLALLLTAGSLIWVRRKLRR